jgi:hypothetical protein
MASFGDIAGKIGVGIGSGAKEVFSQMHVCTIMPMSVLMDSFITQVSTGVRQPNDFGAKDIFLSKLMAYNTLTSGAKALETFAKSNQVYIPIEALVAEVMFITGHYWYYKFFINPHSFSLTHQKLQVEEETSDLTIISTYRNKAMNMSFRGVSGCILSRELLQMNPDSLPSDWLGALLRYPKLSGAWLKFRQLERFWREINTDIAILYDMDLYIGKFTTFNYNQEANNPWVINYDMAFKIYPGLILHTMSMYDYGAFFDAFNQRYGLSYTKTFEGKSKADAY